MKLYLALLVLLLNSLDVHAFTHDDEVHLAAHVGVSYALDNFFYGFNHRVFGMDKTTSEVVAAIESLSIGFLYKYDEGADSKSTQRAMLENGIGVGLSVGTHWVFYF